MAPAKMATKAKAAIHEMYCDHERSVLMPLSFPHTPITALALSLINSNKLKSMLHPPPATLHPPPAANDANGHIDQQPSDWYRH
jgi:hypothetical protein